ncbi:MAG: S41 family peptidase [Geitlerinemataceae cyanobacterium]
MQKRGFWFGLLLAIVAIASWFGDVAPADALSPQRQLVAEAWRIVNRAYVDENFNGQNWWRLREQYLRRRMDTMEAAYDTVDEMLGLLDEPFTRLLRPDAYRNLRVTTSGELTGVGLQIAFDPETKQLRTIAPIAGSPAEAAGIEPGDYILNIDGVPTDRLSLDEAATRMRGAIGTHVVLRVQRSLDRSIEDIDITRAAISIDAVVANLLTTDLAPELKLGYIRLSQFNATATESVAESIADLEDRGANAYVLDLRSNPGGLLTAGIEIARLWLNDSTIVYTVNRQSILESYEAVHNALTDAPLVVLVNRGTASASEILAGALQDNGRALLVGDRTFGKGLIQSLFDLTGDAGLAVTVAKYETPNHRDINKQGIEPDYLVTDKPDTIADLGTDRDPFVRRAIELLAQT